MSLTKWLDPYLTDRARSLRDYLVETSGLDEDLATTIIEARLPEAEVYELPERKTKGAPPWID